MVVTVSSVRAVADETLERVGADRRSRDIIIDTILFANQRGVATHGVGRLPLYVRKIRAGHMNPKDETEVLLDSAAVALLDAHNGFGQVVMHRATELAVEKARTYGVSAVGVRNSNNFGTAGYFGDMAARAGMAAMIYANAAPAIAPTGGSKAIFGTNPICYAFPGTDAYDPILLDMATTVAARGKIRLAAKNGEKIPLGWATDADGKPTDDPNEALKGTLLPFGGYKGYGLSMFVDLLAGLLTGSAFGGNVKNLSRTDVDSRNGHFIVAVDTSRFRAPEDRDAAIAQFRDAVKACGKAGSVLMPGERGYEKRKEQTDFVEISAKQFAEVNEIAMSVGAFARLVPAEQAPE